MKKQNNSINPEYITTASDVAALIYCLNTNDETGAITDPFILHSYPEFCVPAIPNIQLRREAGLFAHILSKSLQEVGGPSIFTAYCSLGQKVGIC